MARVTHRRIVFICRRCGTGFLRYPGRIHPEAMWAFLQIRGNEPVGEDCFGEVIKVDPDELARKLEVDNPTNP